MPAITIDRDVLMREVEDLIAVNTDAKAKSDAFDAAVKSQADTKAKGETDVQAAADKADADDATALSATTAAEVANKVADELLTRQISHLKALIEGHPEDPDPTPTPIPEPTPAA